MSTRVRFAPSPTGFLHIGGLRTALYNYLFAKQTKGKFILRIEDTDRNRFVEGAVDNLIKTLKWSGIKFDEGPGQDSNLGPYFQSERLKIYQNNIKILIDKKLAYPCFYSDARLNEIEENNIASNILTEQDKKYRDLELSESVERMQNENYVVRLKTPKKGEIGYTDAVRGKLKFDLSLIEDQILIKSDGYPTYHFANVVDDYLMKISHVIRGEEWISSMPKHLLLYKYFDWEAPQFIHLPLILNKDKTKLSKRQNDVAVEDYIKKGYLKESVINYLSLLGWHGSGDRELYSIDELVDEFSIERIQKSGAIFDVKKLNWMNNYYIKKLTSKEILDLSQKFIPKEMQVNQEMINLIYEKLERLVDIPDELDFLFNYKLENDECYQICKKEESQKIIAILLSLIKKQENLNSENFKKLVMMIQDDTKIKGKNLWMPIRLAITGQMHGPDIGSIVEILGRDEVIRRIQINE
tara:strand:+ start:6889 stop:8292 length:1404 start_codon:yes stop_codon:yes gene_type:complete